MILNLIQSYIASKQDTLNGYLGSTVKLKQIVTELDLDLIGASESFIHYQLYISSVESMEYETQNFDKVNVKMKFIFQIANKNYTIYKKIFDRYMFGLRRILKSDYFFPFRDAGISNRVQIMAINNISISDGDNIDDEYYKPLMEFDMLILDEENILQTILNSETV
mgnify:CR=1 FL=1